jgi:sec-independent protein translocase protein TatC
VSKDKSLSVIDHLEELRRCIFVALIAILVATAVAFVFSDALLKVILLPSGGLQLNAFSLMDGFFIKWRLALYAGIVIAFPIWAYEVYAFISPGLLEQEKRTVIPALAGSAILFVLGALFGFYLMGGMIRVLVEMLPTQVQFLPSADDYINFVAFFLLACGLAFQLPTLLIVLAQLRILSSDTMRRQRRLAYFALFAFSEVITPIADPIIAPLTVMVPLVILYEISIFFARQIEKRRKLELAVELAAS